VVFNPGVGSKLVGQSLGRLEGERYYANILHITTELETVSAGLVLGPPTLA